MSSLHRSLAEMPTVFVNNRAESVLGQEGFGSSVELPYATIPAYSQAAQSCSWKRRACLQKLAPEPLQDVARAERSTVWRPVLYSWKRGSYSKKGIVKSLLFTFGWKFTGRVKCYCATQSMFLPVSLLGSVTKACMILRSIEELQHKPGMVSKTQSELCNVFPL